MQALKWIGSLIASTIGVAVLLGIGAFFSVFWGLIVTFATIAGAVLIGAYAIVDYLDYRKRIPK